MKDANKVPPPDTLFKTLFALRSGAVQSNRLFIDNLAALLPPPRGTKRRLARVAGRPASWIGGFEDSSGRILYYLHGGGYAMGSLRSHRSLTAYLARAARAKALLVDYRRAPEHPFPAALEDALAGYRALLDAGADPRRLVIAGDSAGGGLCVSLMLSLKEGGLPLPAAAHLMSPWVDLTKSNRPFYDFIFGRKCLVDWNADFLASLYCQGHEPENPLISPLYGDLSGLPPLLVTAGRTEPLRMDGRNLVQKAKEQGVKAVFVHYESPMHVVQALAPLSRQVRRIVSRAGDFLVEHSS
jgi:acetyl esterase/lipase